MNISDIGKDDLSYSQLEIAVNEIRLRHALMMVGCLSLVCILLGKLCSYLHLFHDS
jgi:hypothetical protein